MGSGPFFWRCGILTAVRTWYRPLSRAFLFAMVMAVIVDMLLAMMTRLTAVFGGPGTPWWVAGHVLERAQWILFAAALVMLARRGDDGSACGPGVRTGAWRATGLAVAILPVLWTLAGVAIQLALVTAAGRWAIDGQMYLAPDFYRRLLVVHVPWILAGATTVVVSRHVE